MAQLLTIARIKADFIIPTETQWADMSQASPQSSILNQQFSPPSRYNTSSPAAGP